MLNLPGHTLTHDQLWKTSTCPLDASWLPTKRNSVDDYKQVNENFWVRTYVQKTKGINACWCMSIPYSINWYFTSIGWYCTTDSNVIIVITVMDTPCPTCAVSKSVGSIRTREAIQPNLTSSLTIVSTAVEGIGFSVKWTELKGEWETNNYKRTIPQKYFYWNNIHCIKCKSPSVMWKTYRYPSCRQTVSAAYWSKLSSHTVPQLPLWNTSTRPLERSVPFTRRKSGIEPV